MRSHPWHYREPAVPGVHIVQLEGDDDHAAGHAIVRVRVSVDLEWIASCAAVQRQAVLPSPPQSMNGE